MGHRKHALFWWLLCTLARLVYQLILLQIFRFFSQVDVPRAPNNIGVKRILCPRQNTIEVSNNKTAFVSQAKRSLPAKTQSTAAWLNAIQYCTAHALQPNKRCSCVPCVLHNNIYANYVADLRHVFKSLDVFSWIVELIRQKTLLHTLLIGCKSPAFRIWSNHPGFKLFWIVVHITDKLQQRNCIHRNSHMLLNLKSVYPIRTVFYHHKGSKNEIVANKIYWKWRKQMKKAICEYKKNILPKKLFFR